MRDMVAAGKYYSKAESVLKENLEEAFKGERGPGALPTFERDDEVKAVIAPHSPYKYAAPCAAWSYKALAESEMPDVYVIIGSNHLSNRSGTTTETFQTPLGLARVDQDLAKSLVRKGNISLDDEIHNEEHTVEVQLPYLQFANESSLEKIKILPILLSESDTDLKQLVLDIKEALVEENKTACYIISSNFTHYGPDYRHVPFSMNVPKQIYDFDDRAITLIRQNKPEEFYNYVEENLSTIDGAFPIRLLMELLKPYEAQLEQYYTTGDITGDYENTVSYGSVVFREE